MFPIARHSLLPLAALGLVAGVAAAPSVATTPDIARNGTTVGIVDVDRATIPQLERLMDSGDLSAAQLTHFYLNRIERLNPKLHAVIRVSSTALAEARAADQARARGDDRPMLGIPVLVKDNIDTTGMATTAGSLALAGNQRPDAFIAARLKAAGALIIGKTNLSEWANFRSSQSSSGWSAVGGQTNMAYVLDRNPCGSSSGSGVAASADLATVTIGTETDGSIVCPAGQNGDVGIKPTLGLASRSGIVPISAEQDTAGPITRNVTDAAVVLGTLTGVDPSDPATAGQVGHVKSDYTRFLDPEALHGARIGVWRSGGNFGVSPETDRVMEHAITELKHLGATIVDPANIPIEPAYGPEGTALNYEFKHDIAAYLSDTARRFPKTLADLIAFNREHRAQEMKWFGQEVFLAAQASGPLSDPAYIKARHDATTIARQAINQTLADHNLDAVIAPTNSPAWTTDLVNGDHFLLGSSSPSAISGFPNVTVPAGYADGLPIGMSFIAGKWSEPNLIALGYAWEQATHVRKPPQFLPHLP